MRVLEISLLPEEKRVRFTVEIDDPCRYTTSQMPHILRPLFDMLPRLYNHTCHNGTGKSFRQECQNTETAHLLEHLIIELQLLAQNNPDDQLRGETEWNWYVDPKGRYHVTVQYQDELLAIASIRLAERIVAALDRRDVSIDIYVEVQRLQAMLELGRALSGDGAFPIRSPRPKDLESITY